jgi:hypothetical protein
MYVNITLTKTCIAYPRHLFFDSSPGISLYFPVFAGISGFLLESALNEVTKNPKRRFLLASGYLRAFVLQHHEVVYVQTAWLEVSLLPYFPSITTVSPCNLLCTYHHNLSGEALLAFVV